jgi:hypothetical protein
MASSGLKDPLHRFGTIPWRQELLGAHDKSDEQGRMKFLREVKVSAMAFARHACCL